MPGVETKYDLRASLTQRLCEARAATSTLFDVLREDAIHDRPIPERNRIIFYLGHFEAFDWNIICRNSLGLESFHPDFDTLFAFGIDPVDGQLPADQSGDWPGAGEVLTYNRRVVDAVDEALATTPLDDPTHPNFLHGKAIHVAIEHRLMHAETLAYMFHWLPLEKKNPLPTTNINAPEKVHRRRIEIPAGAATLGAGPPTEHSFGWDNEYIRHTVDVPTFTIDSHNVTNSDFLEFVDAGGYADKRLWSESDWTWKESAGIGHPHFWRSDGDEWTYICMFDEIPLPDRWPVYVSHAEASAYARWKGLSLPTEAQFHRAAYGTPEGNERFYPWGDDHPGANHGNFDFRRWDPVPVGSYPGGDSAFGVADLLGNGWEWTSTVFEPFEGFEKFPFYPRYSSYFFDGKHFVVKGASARTARTFLRPSYRNWFQARYPYIYSAFRLVDSAA